MTEIRAKDKLFLLAVIPALVVAAYFYCWRAETAKRLAMREAQCESLVSEDEFPHQMRIAKIKFKEAMEKLEAEKAKPLSQILVKANQDASAAAREKAALAFLLDEGLCVAKSEIVDVGNLSSSGADALKATGACDNPISVLFTVDGSYPAVRRALENIDTTSAAIIPASVELRQSAMGRWTIGLWL